MKTNVVPTTIQGNPSPIPWGRKRARSINLDLHGNPVKSTETPGSHHHLIVYITLKR
jgi:hypothetical protein